MWKKILASLLVLVALLAIAFLGLRWKLSHPLPEAESGPAAEALAREMQASVDHDAWKRTRIVRWTFRGEHSHVWDRTRGLALVAWEEDGPGDLVEVWVRLEDQRGLVHRRGQLVAPDEADAWIDRAWTIWCNDSFWLNPIAKVFDDGTERGLVDLPDGRQGLLVGYSSGGVTPGDSYLWILGDDARPEAWRMWTRIVPIPGLETSWEGWLELDSGAVVATRHRTPLGVLEVDVERNTAPGDEDPFAALVLALGGSTSPPDSTPAAGPQTAQTASAEPADEAMPLAGTSWQLVEIRSMDDEQGTTKPEDPSLYTLQLGEDGSLAMRLDCNRGMGSWTAEPAGDGTSGSFTLDGPLAMTRALCPPPSLDTRISRDMGYVRGYLLKDGMLSLSLMADGGVYLWEPLPEAGADASETEAQDAPDEPGAG